MATEIHSLCPIRSVGSKSQAPHFADLRGLLKLVAVGLSAGKYAGLKPRWIISGAIRDDTRAFVEMKQQCWGSGTERSSSLDEMEATPVGGINVRIL